jgi:hypothetical protein
MYGSQTILESSQAPPPNKCLRSVHCHYRSLFCVTSGIFAGRAQRDPAKSHELHKITFPNVLHTRFFLILTKKKVSLNVKRSNEFH